MAIMDPLRLKVSFGELRSCRKRFPYTILFVLAFALWCALMVVPGFISLDEDIIVGVGWTLFEGILLSYALTLSLEDERKGKGVGMMVPVLWLFLAAIGGFYSFAGNITWADRLGMLAITIAIPVVGLWAIFRKEEDDVALLRFLLREIYNGLLCWAVGLVAMLGVFLLYWAFYELFGLRVETVVYQETAIFALLVLSPLLFLLTTPISRRSSLASTLPGKEKYDRKAKEGSVERIFGRYILLPILLVYMGVLYAYAAKILFTWELPRGWVSYLVGASVAVLSLVVVFLHPRAVSSNLSSFERRLLRVLPYLMVPLILLMSVGIWRRISDYGLTIPRVYLVFFNLWCYGLCLALVLYRMKRVWWIPLSLSLLLLLLSVGPQNATSLTRRQLRTEVVSLLKSAGEYTLPLDEFSYRKVLESIDEEKALSLSSKIAYLKTTFDGNDGIEGIVGEDVNVRSLYTSNEQYLESIRSPYPEEEYFGGNAPGCTFDIPAGYTRVGEIDSEKASLHPYFEKDVIDAVLGGNWEALFSAPKAVELVLEDDEKGPLSFRIELPFPELPLTLSSEDRIFVITGIHASWCPRDYFESLSPKDGDEVVAASNFYDLQGFVFLR